MAKILIIEDDAAIAAIERDYLELGGYEVSICADGASGLTAALEQTYGEEHHDGEHDGHDSEDAWKSQITPLTPTHFVIFGVAGLLWLLLLAYYWLLTAAWLYRSAVNEGMNKSLWMILGLVGNLLAVAAFLIVRDAPRRKKAAV